MFDKRGKSAILIITLLLSSFLGLAQRFDRGGEEPTSAPTIGGIVIMVLAVLIIIWIKGGKDLKRRKKAFEEIGSIGNEALEFGRYAIKNRKKLEYPIAFVEMDELVIVSKAEADKTGEFKQSIKIPIDEIQSVDITKTKDPYARSSQNGFTGSLTITELNSEITELVFNDCDREVKRFNKIKNRLINMLNSTGKEN